MTSSSQAEQLIQDLARASNARQEIALHLGTMVKILVQSEAEATQRSGAFGWEQTITDLEQACHKLKAGVFRLLVLGDMKRGKSTFLNALIGENLLPSDVNPCTALLTILRYGSEKKVTVHFSSDRSPEVLTFDAFKTQYTIDPSEAKQLEGSQDLAFPEVSHAVVEYPLALLSKGVEIVDSPGLNDTEARNNLSLSYIQNCHALLFVLRATQPCTLAERRYLDNYIKDRGLAVFFLINAWDQIKDSLLDPEDPEELAQANRKLHQVFQTHLQDYCQVDGYNLYDERVFPISALQALRQRIRNAALDGTGFPEFMAALNIFLTQERIIAEFRQARTIAQQTTRQVAEAIARRIPLLDQSITELQGRINAVQPEFKSLTDIGERFRTEIRHMRDRQSQAIADSFRDYTLALPITFEADFLRYQPSNLGFLEYFSQERREAFNQAFKKAFESYLKDKMINWANQAEKELEVAFNHLKIVAERYGQSYQKVTDQMTEKLTGQQYTASSSDSVESEMPGWAKWAMGVFSVATGNLGGATLALGGFDFNTILLNLFTAMGIAVVASSIFGVILGPITFALVGLGLGALQADQARQKFAQVTKEEFVKHLPRLAQDQWQPIYATVQESFNQYEHNVISRLESDVSTRRSELNNLVAQKNTREIDCTKEKTRLVSLQQTLEAETDHIETLYRQFIMG